MRQRLLFVLILLYSSDALAGAQKQLEPHLPLGVTWTMSIDQVRHLPGLERAADGTLTSSYTIHATSQIELVARWQGRAISFLIARDFGLYAIGVDMVPQAHRNVPSAADVELRDLEHCAPIRHAIMRKYGLPRGLGESWQVAEVTPLPAKQTQASSTFEASSIDWPYARNWLIWEGQDTRLALGEEFVWYASRAGLARREHARQRLAEEALAAQEQDAEERAQRQQQLDQARQAVPPRALEIQPLF